MIKGNINRRQALKAIGGTVGVGALAAVSGCDKPIAETNQRPPSPPGIVGKDGKRVLPWRNWSGNQQAQPSLKKVPRNLEQLQSIIANAEQRIRCVGAGHSFSALVPTDETLLSLARIRGVKRIDTHKKQADIAAGTVLAKIGEPLWEKGLSLINMPDINTQALAGALATSTHGTGRNLGSMSSNAVGYQVFDGKGELQQCSAEHNPELFYAMGNHLGCLGVLTQVTMQAEDAYKLEENSWILPEQAALEQADVLSKQHRHFELYAFPHADYMLCLSMDKRPLDTPDKPLSVTESNSETFRSVADWTEKLPFLRSFILNRGLQGVEDDKRIGSSHQIFGNLRDIRFNEMEYSVPEEVGTQCLGEILHTIKRLDLDVIFPIEFRYVQQDNIWLSPFYKRNSCAISIHNFHDKDYKDYFAVIEPILRKYDGRPHWGKIHTLNTAELAALYPNFNDFLAVRESLDPTGKFLNPYVQRVLGLS